MLLSTEWLSEFVALDDTPEAIADRLTGTGNEIEEIRDSPSGPVFYLKLTPNRADMLSIAGAARELGALYERPVRTPCVNLAAGGPPRTDVRVDVAAADLCPRYVARIIEGVKVGPSPEWLRSRLEAVGLRSISNVVDVTNYVMWELGQPLHAFDLDRLAGNRILVRRATEGEPLRLIDGTEARLTPENLVIADDERPVAVAGVMGGQESEVTDSTSRILLESAYFDPTSVRRTSKRIGVSSAASYRFERGVDPNGVLFAADRAAALITEVAGGTVSSTLFDRYPVPIRPRAIVFRPGRCRDLLGIDVSDIAAREYLERLGMSVTALGPCGWQVSAPTNRPDLAIEEDLIEEVGRLYGYDRLPETLPGGAASGALNGRELFVRRVRDALTAEGLFEAVGNTLTSPNLLSTSGLSLSPIWPAEESASQVPLRNPLSEEFSVLRPSLLPGLLAAAQHNLRRGTQDVFLFEAGYGNARIGSGEPEYHLLVSGLLLGSRWSGSWNAASATTEFFAAKGTVEGLLRGLGLPSAAAARADHPALHPGRSAWLRVGAERVGIIGELHPDRAAALDLPRGVYLFELDGEALQRAFLAQRRIYEPPSRHPRALRDLAVVVDDTVPSAAVEKILSETLGTWCRNVRLFDVYTGPPLAAGRSSLAYALELGADERTLTDAEVDERLNIARERLRTELAAEFRG